MGTITEISGKTATVVFGQIKTTVKLSRLQRTIRKAQSGATKTTSFISAQTTESSRERQLNFSQEIDVRGMRVDEAVQAVMYFLRICRKRSRSHWRITWELTLKCLSATVCVCMISMRE